MSSDQQSMREFAARILRVFKLWKNPSDQVGLGGAEPNGRGGARRSELTSGGDVTLCPILFYYLLPRTLTYSIQGTANEQMK